MANIKVDFSKKTGKIKAMHGVGQPPFEATDFSMIEYLKKAGVPYSRLHDVGGGYGGMRWVDVPNIFGNFDADPYDPASYNFLYTDMLIKALVDNNVEPYFRLGVTIENFCPIKYRIYPPADYQKWAVIGEHIIRHYTEGWSNGFNYDIKYWEIWNEPDNSSNPDRNPMWKGEKETYYEFYCVAAKHLKSKFPHLMIGGYGSCGFYNLTGSDGSFGMTNAATAYYMMYAEQFLAYVKKENAPLDFFSWHTYDPEYKNNAIYANFAKKLLDDYGFTETETSCNEWNCRGKLRGTYEHAAVTEASMLIFQNSALDNAMFYDARFGPSIYGGLFNFETREPYPAYYSLTAYNRIYELKDQAVLECDDEEVIAVAAANENTGCIVITNPTAEAIPFEVSAQGKMTKCIITADGKNDAEVELPAELPAFSIISLYFDLA